jgi:RAV-like factor
MRTISEKVGDGLDKKNERSNGNVNNDKRLSHQYHVRPEAKDRASYMNIGTYKFGANCKFNHPIRRKNQAQLLPPPLLLELLFGFVFSRVYILLVYCCWCKSCVFRQGQHK